MLMLPRRRPEFLGYLDSCDSGRVSGWVRDRLRPGKRFSVEVFAEGRLVGSARADAFRQDLRDSGVGDGRHAFSLDLPDNGEIAPETLAAKVGGSDYWLLDGTGVESALALMNGRRRGSPALRAGLTAHAVNERDIEVAAELLREWQAYVAVTGSTRVGGPMWTDIVSRRHGAILQHLRGNDASALARAMVDVHKTQASRGLFQGDVAFADFVGATPNGRRAAVAPFHDMLASLAQYLGLARADCAELDVSGATAASPSDELVKCIEASLGHAIVPPVIYDGVYGLALGDAVLHGRDVQALYAARRLIETSGQPAPRLCEIGGGFGRVGYYAMLGGARRYTIIDLPSVSAMQFFALRRSLPDVPVRFGPAWTEGAINLVFATDERVGSTFEADLVFNADSFPEMGEAVCRRYFALLAASGSTLLSINQEAGTPVGSRDVQAVVGEIIPDFGFRRRYRFRTWLRRGFVEELWTPDAAP